MTDKEAKFVAYWEATMKQGRLRYALLHGSIFGFLIFLFTFIFSFLDDSYDEMFVMPKIFGVILIFILGGVIFEGGYTWWMNTKKHTRLTSQSS